MGYEEPEVLLCFVSAAEWDASTIVVFIPFQKEAYTSSTAGRVMLRAIFVIIGMGMVRVYCGNFENKTNYHNWKVGGLCSNC